MSAKETSLYGELYLAAFEHVMTPELSRAEANFVLEVMDLQSGDLLIDVGCGHGRHHGVWRDHGIRVLGVDIETYPLELQKAKCPGPDARLLIMANMLAIPFRQVPAIVAISSWGLMSSEDNADAIREIYRSLERGGRFLLRTLGIGSILPDPFRQTDFSTPSGLKVRETRTFDHLTCMSWTDILVKKDLEEYSLRHSVRIYVPPELASLLSTVGFRIQNIWGNMSRSPANWDSQELVVLCCKE